MADKLDLFPLHSILLPGCLMDLQIFEARYLDMVSRCFKQSRNFAVVSLESGSESALGDMRFNALGCEAQIVDWQQRDNGLLGIRVEGRRRLRVTSAEVAADGLVSGLVSWQPEQSDQPLEAEHDDLLALHQALLQHPMSAGLGLPEIADSQQRLGYQLAFLLPFSLQQKARLLAIDQPEQRLAQITDWLQEMQA